MNNYLYYYINQLINISPKKPDDNVVYIKNYSTFDIDTFISHLKISDTTLCLKHTYAADDMHTAFEPFLEWIKELCQNDNTLYSNDFFDKCEVYSLHRQLIASYINTGVCERTEEIIIPEIKYDKVRLLQDIVNIFKHISNKQHVIILLNSIHYADSSTFQLLNEFISSSKCNNIFFIFIYNDFYKLPKYALNDWTTLLSFAHDNFFNSVENVAYDQFTKSTVSHFIPKSNNYHDYEIKLSNMLLTLCIDQAIYYLSIIHTKFEIEQMHITVEQRIKMMLLHALAHIYDSNGLAALLLCDKVKSLLKHYPNDNFDFELNYLIALAYEYNNHFNLAQDAYDKCKIIANRINDEFISFKCDILFYTLAFLGWKDIYMHQYLDKIQDSFIIKAKQYNYINHLAYVIAFGYKESACEEDIANRIMYPHLDEGISYAKQLGNDNFILIAYQEKIYTSSCKGIFDGLDVYQKKCVDILSKMNNPKELATMYNSLGYNCSVHEDFSNANKYYNMAIKIILDNNLTDDMYEAFYNKSILAIQTMNYPIACEYLKTSLMFIDELKIEKLRIANKSKLYGLLALCHYYMNTEYNCYLYLAKLERYVTHILDVTDEKLYFLWDDDLFLYYFIKAILSKHDGAYEVATKEFEKAKYHMNRSTENRYFSYPVYALERAELYSLLGQPEEGQKTLKECIDFCTENHYSFKYMIVNSVYTKLTLFKPSYDLSLGDIDMEQIKNMAKQSGVTKSLANRNSDVNFLSTWKELMTNAATPDILIDNAMSGIRSNFALDGALFYNVFDDNISNILYSNSDVSLTDDDMTLINNTLLNLTSGFVTSRTEDEFINFKNILSIFGVNKVASILFSPVMKNEKLTHVFIGYITLHNNFIDNTSKLTEDNLEIVSFAIRQLVDSLNILEAQLYLRNVNKMLEVNSITDILTGIYNRQGMYKVFSERIKENNQYNVIYVDLDNFKSYNDTFGHDIGDQILVEFSSLLNRCIDENSYLVRYGGDEFIIMNHSDNQEDAILISKAIYEELKQCDYLDYVIEDISNQKHLTLPDSQIISCSIGIASGSGSNDLDKVIINADNELFKIKKSTKNNYSIYTE